VQKVGKKVKNVKIFVTPLKITMTKISISDFIIDLANNTGRKKATLLYLKLRNHDRQFCIFAALKSYSTCVPKISF
jgi:hypothetical protein